MAKGSIQKPKELNLKKRRSALFTEYAEVIRLREIVRQAELQAEAEALSRELRDN